MQAEETVAPASSDNADTSISGNDGLPVQLKDEAISRAGSQGPVSLTDDIDELCQLLAEERKKTAGLIGESLSCMSAGPTWLVVTQSLF